MGIDSLPSGNRSPSAGANVPTQSLDDGRGHRHASAKAKLLVGQSATKTNKYTFMTTNDVLFHMSPAIVLANVRRNRDIRERGRHQTKKNKQNENTRLCPICNATMGGDDREVNEHIDRCLAMGVDQSTSEITTGGTDFIEAPYEMYEWAGQTRVRTVSLLEGGLEATLGKTVSSSNKENLNQTKNNNKLNKDDDDDLDIENDQSKTFGPPQYTDTDITDAVIQDETTLKEINDDESNDGEPTNELQRDALVAALKAKIRQQDELIQHKPKCLICLEMYKIPVCSVNCWHVYCESCWLQTLAAKKLCPQCNVIVTPSDLRKIYF